MRPGSAAARRLHRRCGGFTYVWVLFAVALMGIGLAVTGMLWSKVAAREREAHLTWVGEQYVRAIASYYEAVPGSARKYPPTLDELLIDSRFAGTRRHLRRLYANPRSGRFDWRIVPAVGGGVMGVEAPEGGSGGEGAGARRSFVYLPLMASPP